MTRGNDFIILGIILLIVAGGLYYYTLTPVERTITTQEYVTKERVVTKKELYHVKRCQKTRDCYCLQRSVIADSHMIFSLMSIWVIAEPFKP
jgi:hypothetical protein